MQAAIVNHPSFQQRLGTGDRDLCLMDNVAVVAHRFGADVTFRSDLPINVRCRDRWKHAPALKPSKLIGNGGVKVDRYDLILCRARLNIVLDCGQTIPQLVNRTDDLVLLVGGRKFTDLNGRDF